MVVLLAVELLDELVFGAREAALPLIRDDLGLSYAQVGLLLALPQLASALVEPAVGVLGDVWRRRVLVGGGGVLYGLALLLAATSSGLVHLLVAFLLLYPSSGAFVGLSQATLMDAAPEARERNMLRWTIAGSVGALVGPLCVAAATVLALGWRPLFLAFAAGALGLALVSLRADRPRLPAPAAGGVTVRAAGRELVAALRRPPVLRWLLLLEASDLLLDVLLAFTALYLVDEAGLSPAGAALAVSGTLGAGLAGNVVLLPLIARVGALRYLHASALAAGVLFAGALLAPTAAKVPLLVALAFTTAGWYPVLKARLYRALPDRSGTAMALGSVAGLLGALPPLAVGALAARFGLGAALWLLLLAPVALLALVPRSDSPD